jgi:DNA-binding FadR family transcriptional regulator
MTELADDLEPFQLQKVRVKKAAEIVAGQIRNAIVRGELRAGETLPTEAVLIERFEVSRPTIREAIRILESENLLQVSRGARGGARIALPATEFVARILGQTLQARGGTLGDLYQARRLIEPPAARMAAEIRPKEAAEALRQHIAFERGIKEDRAGTAGAITSFHRLLVEQSQNKTLTLLIDALSEITEKHLTLVYRNRHADDAALRLKRLEQGFRSHERLADKIGKGDGAGAEAHWHKHMTNVESFWLQGIRESSLDVLE